MSSFTVAGGPDSEWMLTFAVAGDTGPQYHTYQFDAADRRTFTTFESSDVFMELYLSIPLTQPLEASRLVPPPIFLPVLTKSLA